MINQAVFEALLAVLKDQNLDDLIDLPPEKWTSQQRETYDALMAMEYEVIKKIFANVFFPSRETV